MYLQTIMLYLIAIVSKARYLTVFYDLYTLDIHMRLEMDSNGSKQGSNLIRILIPELPSLWRRLRLRAFVLC